MNQSQRSEEAVGGSAQARSVAAAFTMARRQASALPDFPGALPPDMAQAYAIQEAAIGLWPDAIAGWKIGLIAPDLRERLGAERLAGPIFSRAVSHARTGVSAPFPIFAGGFAAVEGEFVYRLGSDADPARRDWTGPQALDLVEAMFIGVEAAGSPLASINDLGPAVTVSDFGNNAGLILGATIEHWRDLRDQDLECETFIDGHAVGRGSGARLPRGPAGALAFLLNNLAERGRAGRAGELVSTGAVTGVHDIRLGQSARIDFGRLGEILCHGEPAQPAA